MHGRRFVAVLAALSLLITSVLLSPALVAAQATPASGAASKTGNGRARTAPLAFGRAVHVGEYTLKVVDVTPDATDAVMATNQFNDPPAEGRQFFMVRIEAKYNGNGSGNVWSALSFKSVGQSNVGYDVSNSRCGVIPDQAYDVGELFEGGVAQFNVCWSVKTEDADSLLMYVDAGYSKDTRRWFSLDKATAPK